MKINKQLFEDILSGKLKGTFVLRNGEKILSDALRRQRHFYGLYIDEYLYFYYDNGRYSCDSETRADIIDFIPDTNMKENELTIEIPEGQEIDWQESAKQEKIVFKKKENTKPRSWEEYCKNNEDKQVWFVREDKIHQRIIFIITINE